MSELLVWVAAAALAAYAACVAGLYLTGRRTQARAVAGFVPDCALLFGRLARDPRVPRRSRLAIAALALYLASPIDLVPDFVPVAGQLDDAILVVLALRLLLRASGPELLREHWPGPEGSLGALLRLAGRSPAPGRVDDPYGHQRDDRADHDARAGRVGDRGHRP